MSDWAPEGVTTISLLGEDGTEMLSIPLFQVPPGPQIALNTRDATGDIHTHTFLPSEVKGDTWEWTWVEEALFTVEEQEKMHWGHIKDLFKEAPNEAP